MTRTLPSTFELGNALRDEGFDLPKECADVRLMIPVDGIFQLQYEVNVYGESLAQLGRALVRIAKDSR